jgi:hypothetical protein
VPTASTIPLLLLIAFLWSRTRGEVLSVVLFVSIFDAASALNFGNFGVPPWAFALILCMGLKLLHGHGGLRIRNRINKPALHLFVLFVLYALWTGCVHPFLFQGVPVIRASLSPNPLSWSMANFAQICYLLASVVVYLLAISRSKAELQVAVDWYLRACVVAALIACYQLAHELVHIPYPDSVLHSNPGHVIYTAYTIHGIWRLNGPFTEASDMASYMTVGLALLGWRMLTRPLGLKLTVSFLIVFISVVLTLSTLGYASLILIALLGTVFAIRHLLSRGLSPAKMVSGILLFAAIAGTFAAQTPRQVVAKVVTSTLLEKENTSSYRDRTATHRVSLETAANTYYMGAGWGSARASGLGFMLLANVGVPGLALFLLFVGALYIPAFRFPQANACDLYEQAIFGATVMLAGLMVAGAEPVQPILWTLLGVATLIFRPHRSRVLRDGNVRAFPGPARTVAITGLPVRILPVPTARGLEN